MADDHKPITGNGDITELRAHLFDAIRGVRAGNLLVEDARAINDLAKTIVASASVEVEFQRDCVPGSVPFMEQKALPAPPDDGKGDEAGNQAGRTVHRLRG